MLSLNHGTMRRKSFRNAIQDSSVGGKEKTRSTDLKSARLDEAHVSGVEKEPVKETDRQMS